ncbi:MAG TPA: OmpA family protein [Acidobacteriaceae bacterium]|nr:OmpA family protein [Acidobacteriaceae bacterium]
MTVTPGSIAAILLAASLGSPAIAQNTPAANGAAQTSATTPAPATTTGASTSGAATDSSTYATGQPLPEKSNEGFWGKLNPLARKKWVNRQVSPVKDRLNELDQLTAKNANDIKDVDARAQAGIHQAQTTADQANQQAQQASTQAGQAQQLAQQANQQTTQLNSTVTNLDQYQQVADTELHFRSSQIGLNDKAKEALDQVATQLQGQKGYIVEVQGYSHVRGEAGIQKSQNMADAVVRYLVVDHHVPVYRIYRLAMGNAPREETTASSTTGTVVHVTLMHNSLAALNSPTNQENGGSPIGATQQPTPQPSPRNAASQPQQ